MNSDEENMYVDESDEDMSDDDHMNIVMEPEVTSTTHDGQDEDFPHKVLSPSLIVQHMIDCIQEVNSIVQVAISNQFNSYDRLQVCISYFFAEYRYGTVTQAQYVFVTDIDSG